MADLLQKPLVPTALDKEVTVTAPKRPSMSLGIFSRNYQLKTCDSQHALVDFRPHLNADSETFTVKWNRLPPTLPVAYKEDKMPHLQLGKHEN
tara:strand:+ start:218 stop:496 length:279 start_codon:yes stop_codon:yes gene_type:complete